MKTNELIAANNEKRELLSTHNEAYYEKLLLYIRTQLLLSEHQSEEILMEMLDHLLDGQQEGKNAEDIFSEHPVAYADTIIAQLPREKKGNIAGFLAEISCMIVGTTLLIRGVALLILGMFVEVNEEVHLLSTLLHAVLIALFIIVSVWFLLKRLQASILHDRSNVKDMLLVGLFVALCMGALLFLIILLPQFGWVVTFPWWASLLAGAVILIVHKRMKHKKQSA